VTAASARRPLPTSLRTPDQRRFRLTPTAVALALLALIAGCGGSSGPRGPDRRSPTGFVALPASYIPLPVGPGPRYQLTVRSPTGRAIAGLPCAKDLGPRFGAHVELFAYRRVVPIPPGIGVVAPVRQGAVVRSGRCYYPIVTLGPTGVIEVARQTRRLTLGDVFAIWGHAISRTRLAGFTGQAVHVFVDGRLVPGDPAEIRLERHAEIVLETSGYVVPHASYGFVDGL
jgi:hypothetical protein